MVERGQLGDDTKSKFQGSQAKSRRLGGGLGTQRKEKSWGERWGQKSEKSVGGKNGRSSTKPNPPRK